VAGSGLSRPGECGLGVLGMGVAGVFAFQGDDVGVEMGACNVRDVRETGHLEI
jgi:hypothetical protein